MSFLTADRLWKFTGSIQEVVRHPSNDTLLEQYDWLSCFYILFVLPISLQIALPVVLPVELLIEFNHESLFR